MTGNAGKFYECIIMIKFAAFLLDYSKKFARPVNPGFALLMVSNLAEPYT